jgi:hydroxypyruvate reductase
LNNEDLRKLARAIFIQTLAECGVERAFAGKLVAANENGSTQLQFCGERVAYLDQLRHIRVVAVGKAAVPMLQSLLDRLKLSPSCDLAGILIALRAPEALPPGFQFFAGGHPYPTEASFAGARAVLSLVRAVPQGGPGTHEALCIFLISGGASAMMELPLDQTISLQDTVAFHRALVLSGCSITEINCVRKHFSAVKGGRVAMAAGKTPCVSLLISDVPPRHPDVIASGPTLPDPSSSEQCREILTRYRLFERFPDSVRHFFASSFPETPKPGELQARAWTLLGADDLAEAAQQQARVHGFHSVIDNSCDDWDYREAAEYLLDRVRALRRNHPRGCLISTGEVTVRLPRSIDMESNGHLHGNAGVGGRNQQFALYASTLLNVQDGSIVVLSAGSDGMDGNSNAAGAVVDEQMLDGSGLRARAESALATFDSSTFLESAGATIHTGATGNNLRDLRIILYDSAC